MEGRNYAEKEVELATRILKLFASYCARFWAEKLTNSETFWSCKTNNKSVFQMEPEFMQKQIPYIPISTDQVFKFIKIYEKLAVSEIALVVKKDTNVAIILGHSDEEVHPGFTSGINSKGEPEFFLRQVMKSVGITGVFLDMQEHHIAIKSGKLYLEYHNEKQVLCIW